MKSIVTITKKICAELSNQDKVLSAVIEKYGELDYTIDSNYFESLLSTIIGQQLASKVADKIWSRFLDLFPNEITLEGVLNLSNDALLGVGLSRNKALYIKTIASSIVEGRLTLDKFDEMDDLEIKKQLVSIKGIGEWTAEMFLIFSMGRVDVFSCGDGGLSRAISKFYNDGKALTQLEKIEISKNWMPYRSIASLYLWKSLENK
ncbi:MAG: DNA-3-methyladenine glycosylase [Christensenellaceae bacterium]|jgi:DNA-3-methyladenine glycosylase II|nr:DNA-3-methyladenine glycosylase [Christensenellaceae bacterium]